MPIIRLLARLTKPKAANATAAIANITVFVFTAPENSSKYPSEEKWAPVKLSPYMSRKMLSVRTFISPICSKESSRGVKVMAGMLTGIPSANA